jgi:hypothetical protein
MSDDELNAVVTAATEFFDQHLVDVTPEESQKILGQGLSEMRRAHPDIAESALCLAVGRAWGRLDAARDRVEAEPKVHWLFSPLAFWPTMVAQDEVGRVVRNLHQSAALTAAGEPGFEGVCTGCGSRWNVARHPAGLIFVSMARNAQIWVVEPVCNECWDGTITVKIRGALEAKYGIRPGALQLLPEAGNA